MGGYIGATAVGLVTTAADVQGDITSTDTTPEVILKNTTETDADGSRDGKITFKGEQSGGEESVLAQIQSSHDGTSDDEKGDLIFKTNDGSDGASPTERVRIDSNGSILTSTLGTDNVHLGEGAGAAIVSGGNNNVAIGKDALASNTTADNSTAVGFEAGTNSTGAQNTFLGRQTGKGLTSGTESVFIGNGAGRDGTSTGSYNIGIGSVSLNALTSGSNNIATGRDALGANTTGDNNVAVGYQSLDANTTADNNTAIGTSALGANTTAADNVAVGASTLQANTTGGPNTGVGKGALASNTTGGSNTGIGQEALVNVTTSSYNTGCGGAAGYTNTTSSNNTYLGFAAGYLSTGEKNTFVGARNGSHGCGQTMTTGSKNTILGGFDGNQDSVDIRTVDSNIILSVGDGNVQYWHRGADNTTVLAGAHAGNAWTTDSGFRIHGNGATSQWASLTNESTTATDETMIIHRKAAVSNGETIQFYRAGSAVGSITVSSGSTSFNTSSDYRLKENVSNITGADRKSVV